MNLGFPPYIDKNAPGARHISAIKKNWVRTSLRIIERLLSENLYFVWYQKQQISSYDHLRPYHLQPLSSSRYKLSEVGSRCGFSRKSMSDGKLLMMVLSIDLVEQRKYISGIWTWLDVDRDSRRIITTPRAPSNFSICILSFGSRSRPCSATQLRISYSKPGPFNGGSTAGVGHIATEIKRPWVWRIFGKWV